MTNILRHLLLKTKLQSYNKQCQAVKQSKSYVVLLLCSVLLLSILYVIFKVKTFAIFDNSETKNHKLSMVKETKDFVMINKNKNKL